MSEGAVVLGLMLYRVRRVYLAFGLFLLFLIGVAHLPGHWVPTVVAQLLIIPFALGLVITAFAFVNLEADIASTASAYSPWLLRLPVKTSALAFWPIAAAAAWGPLAWIIFVELYLRPLGMNFPASWPAAMLAALGLSMQAILWVPVKRGTVRLVVSIAVPMAIALFGLMVGQIWPETLILSIYLGVAALCAGCAWYGVVRARTSPAGGFGPSGASMLADHSIEVCHSKKTFSSPRAAQFWLEWQRQGRVLPLATGISMLALSVPLVWHSETDYLMGDHTVATNIWVATVIKFLPCIPLLFATAIGMGLRRSDMRGAQGVYHVFYATRPVQSIDLYYAKIKALTVGVLLSVGLTGLTMMAWLCIPGIEPNGTATPYIRIFFSTLSTSEWRLMIGCSTVVLAWTWRNQVVGAFVDYLSHHQWAVIYPLVVVVSGGTIFLFTQTQGEFLHSRAAFGPVLFFVSLLLTAKVVLALVLASKQISLRPAIRTDILRSFATWAVSSAIAATIFGLVIAGADTHSYYPCLQNPVNEMIAILLVPLARPIAARIALETGRHQ